MAHVMGPYNIHGATLSQSVCKCHIGNTHMNTFQSTYCTMYIQSSLERSLLWFIHSEATYQLSVGNLQMHNYEIQKSKVLLPLNFNINMLIPFLKINNKILPVLEEWWKYGWQVTTLWCPFVGTFYVESMVSIKSKTLIQSTRKVPTNELKKVTNFGENIHLKTFQPYL